MDDIFKESRDLLEKQDQQFAAMNTARELAKNGNVDEAIQILEKIMYEDGLVVVGVTWPFILADIYYKNKMYDKCWRYLNFVFTNFPDVQEKTREMQSKLLKQEKRYADALIMKMSSLIIKYTKIPSKPTPDKIEKELNSLIKKAELEQSKRELLELYQKHSRGRFDEGAFRSDFKKILIQ